MLIWTEDGSWERYPLPYRDERAGEGESEPVSGGGND